MKRGDIKYVVDIDYKHPTIYKAEIIKPHKKWENNWLVKYLEVVIDFLNMPDYTLENQSGIYDADTHIFDTIEECVMAIVNSNYGMLPENMIRKLFK